MHWETKAKIDRAVAKADVAMPIAKVARVEEDVGWTSLS